MGTTSACRWHAYPRTDPARRPTPWWYYGRALYVSRRDYFKICCALMLTLGFPLVFLALYVVAVLPESQLVPIYWAIAFLGIAWPWLMTGVALAGEWLTRPRAAVLQPAVAARHS